MGAARTLSSGKGPPSRCPPFLMGGMCPVRLLRELQKLVESEQESFVFRGFNGCLVAKSPGKTTHMWSGSNTISSSGICRCDLVEYLGSLQKISASNSAPNQAEVGEHPPRLTRALMLSYGASMALGIHGQRKSVIWKRTGRLSCPLQDPSWDMATQISFVPRSRIR